MSQIVNLLTQTIQREHVAAFGESLLFRGAPVIGLVSIGAGILPETESVFRSARTTVYLPLSLNPMADEQITDASERVHVIDSVQILEGWWVCECHLEKY